MFVAKANHCKSSRGTRAPEAWGRRPNLLDTRRRAAHEASSTRLPSAPAGSSLCSTRHPSLAALLVQLFQRACSSLQHWTPITASSRPAYFVGGCAACRFEWRKLPYTNCAYVDLMIPPFVAARIQRDGHHIQNSCGRLDFFVCRAALLPTTYLFTKRVPVRWAE